MKRAAGTPWKRVRRWSERDFEFTMIMGEGLGGFWGQNLRRCDTFGTTESIKTACRTPVCWLCVCVHEACCSHQECSFPDLECWEKRRSGAAVSMWSSLRNTDKGAAPHACKQELSEAGFGFQVQTLLPPPPPPPAERLSMSAPVTPPRSQNGGRACWSHVCSQACVHEQTCMRRGPLPQLESVSVLPPPLKGVCRITAWLPWWGGGVTWRRRRAPGAGGGSVKAVWDLNPSPPNRPFGSRFCVFKRRQQIQSFCQRTRRNEEKHCGHVTKHNESQHVTVNTLHGCNHLVYYPSQSIVSKLKILHKTWKKDISKATLCCWILDFLKKMYKLWRKWNKLVYFSNRSFLFPCF